jgi:hypothetical protein
MGSGHMHVAVAIACLAALGVSCSDSSTRAPVTTTQLAPGMAAGAAGVQLPTSLVAGVAQARHVAPRAAADLLIDDALLAQAARDARLDSDIHISAKTRAVYARLSIDQLLASQTRSSPTDEDVAQMTRQLWAQVDRGEARKVTHAIVLNAKLAKDQVPDTPEGNARRAALAERIHLAVRDATSVLDFQARAAAVPTDGMGVKVEGLSPLVADGTALDGTSFDRAFAAGAFSVKEGQAVSEVVPSDFGWHVIYVQERIPAVHMPFEERRALTARLQLEQRTKAAYEAHVAELRKNTRVDISTAAAADMASAFPTQK